MVISKLSSVFTKMLFVNKEKKFLTCFFLSFLLTYWFEHKVAHKQHIQASTELYPLFTCYFEESH